MAALIYREKRRRLFFNLKISRQPGRRWEICTFAGNTSVWIVFYEHNDVCQYFAPWTISRILWLRSRERIQLSRGRRPGTHALGRLERGFGALPRRNPVYWVPGECRVYRARKSLGTQSIGSLFVFARSL